MQLRDNRGNFDKLIAFTLLDCRYQFMGRLYIVNSNHGLKYLVSRYNMHSLLECS